MISRRGFIKVTLMTIGSLSTGFLVAVKIFGNTGADEIKFIVDKGTNPPLKFREKAFNPKANYGMVINLEKCTGCHSCAAACRNEFNVPAGVWRSWVKVIERNAKKYFLPRLCNHCDNAPCVTVCPSTASYKREDGLILMRYNRCIGCKYCIAACPYDARFIDPHKHAVDKCTFCPHRLEQGKEPACVEACPVKARIFGDINDPKSKISDLLIENAEKIQRLKPELGTECKVYYINAVEQIMGMLKISENFVEAIKNYKKIYPPSVLEALKLRSE